MRTWLLIIMLGSSLAVAAMSGREEQKLIDILNVLQVGEKNEHFSTEKLAAMNQALKQFKAKFIMEAISKYQDDNIEGCKYIIKNISEAPIVVAEEFAQYPNLLAFITSDNILAADARATLYVLKKVATQN